MTIPKAKIEKLRKGAEQAQAVRDAGGKGNVRFVFVEPKVLLRLLRDHEKLAKLSSEK